MYKDISEYRIDYYMEIEKKFLISSDEQMVNKEESSSAVWVNNMRNIFDKACQVQEKLKKEKDIITYCKYIRLSFLHIATFLKECEPCFMVEFFADDGDKPWAKTRIPAMDVLGDWQSFVKQAYRKDLWYARYYNPGEIQALLVQTQQKLLFLWLNRAKYWMRDLEDAPEFRRLWVTNEFQMTVGVYRDWQEPIFRLRTDVDLLEANGKTIAGGIFVGEQYREVVLENIDAEPAEFINCYFKAVTFQGGNFADCRFRNCRFYEVTFQRCKFAGVSFEECYWAGCEFMDCDFNPDSEALDPTKLYRGASLRRNKMRKCSLTDSDREGICCHENDIRDCKGIFV